MDINATLFGQTIAMIVFVWFCMKYIWPPLLGAIEERQQKIADGLAAAEKGQQSLDAAQTEAAGIIEDARKQATSILDQANARANEIVAEGKAEGVRERVNGNSPLRRLRSSRKRTGHARNYVARYRQSR